MVLSVLLCSYNAMAYLPNAVSSVLDSKGVEFELIVVNDGSTDGTKAYLDSLNDSRLKVIHLPVNRGIAHAANVGLQHCTGEFIARMDADDICSPYRLLRQVEYLLNHTEVGVVCTQVELSEADFRQEGYQWYVQWTNRLNSHEEMHNQRYRDSPVVNPSACFRTQLIREFGNYKEDVPEDYEFWLRLFEGGVKFEKLNFNGILWRDHASRLTRNHPDYFDEAFTQVKVQYFSREWRKRSLGRPLYIWGKNALGRDWHKALKSMGIPVDGFVDFERGIWKELPMLSIEEALEKTEIFYLIAVRNRKGGALIEEALLINGLQPEVDYYFV